MHANSRAGTRVSNGLSRLVLSGFINEHDSSCRQNGPLEYVAAYAFWAISIQFSGEPYSCGVLIPPDK